MSLVYLDLVLSETHPEPENILANNGEMAWFSSIAGGAPRNISMKFLGLE